MAQYVKTPNSGGVYDGLTSADICHHALVDRNRFRQKAVCGAENPALIKRCSKSAIEALLATVCARSVFRVDIRVLARPLVGRFILAQHAALQWVRPTTTVLDSGGEQTWP
jgi:hypothetical protein